MSRLSNIAQLSTSDRDRLDTIIRTHNYYQLTVMVAAAREQGIETTRTALHKYVQKLAKADGVRSLAEMTKKPNLVVITDVATGKTQTVWTDASAAQIQRVIEANSGPVMVFRDGK